MIIKKYTTNFLLKSFKLCTIFHIVLIFLNVFLHPYIQNHNFIHFIIEYGSFGTTLITTLIIVILMIKKFNEFHQSFIKKYKIIGIFIELITAIILSFLILFNKEITANFINFIIDLSYKTHNHTIILLTILLTLYFCLELHEALTKNQNLINQQSQLKKLINVNIVTLSLKIGIIIGSALVFIHPFMRILNKIQLHQVDQIILNFTTKTIFVYIHTILITLLLSWLIIGIYYIYKFYRKK